MIHDKTGLLHLAEMMVQRGIKTLINSPGSRNAPIVTVFCGHKEINCLSVVDERSAAFFALGMAQQLRQPVAIACTSGSAALNYAPAIAEAYYQRIPLIVLTADRPEEWIDQGDGQTIRQKNVFGPHVRKSVQLPQSTKNNDDLWYNDRLISEALNAAIYPVAGPVHINLPFSEPLYGFDHSLLTQPKDIRIIEPQQTLNAETLASLSTQWNRSKKKLVLVGQMLPDSKLQHELERLSADPSVAILSETTSNIYHPDFNGCIDRSLSAMANAEDFYPEILLTFGGPIVSKRIKSFFRKASIKEHWNIDPADLHVDTYQHLTHSIPMQAVSFLEQLNQNAVHPESDFKARWLKVHAHAREIHKNYLVKTSYSDLKIFETIIESIPDSAKIQLANSTPVRYSQLFEYKNSFQFDSNRGTSGIDGSLSTAAGAAFASERLTVLITGDLGFFYDSNALWNKHIPANLKIIVINNEGGGIFRFIDGPSDTGLLEPFFEARHQTSARYIAEAFGADYHLATDKASLTEQLGSFFEPSDRVAVLEIKSPARKSAEVLKCYFKELEKKSRQRL
jgi:2-succinyl-5-enolpyruvyl-6-hydroxy-3-cyclohexene-1-carboxylate synthase